MHCKIEKKSLKFGSGDSFQIINAFHLQHILYTTYTTYVYNIFVQLYICIQHIVYNIFKDIVRTFYWITGITGNDFLPYQCMTFKDQSVQDS